MKLNQSKKWYEKHIELEKDLDIGVGSIENLKNAAIRKNNMVKESKETIVVPPIKPLKISKNLIKKQIKGLSVGKDKWEIMKRVAYLLGKDIKNFDYIVEEYLNFEECYTIGVTALEEKKLLDFV